MKKIIEIRFELTTCWLAFRLNPQTGGISGHYKDWDGQRYHNTIDLNPNQGNVCKNCMDDLDEAQLLIFCNERQVMRISLEMKP